MQPVQVSSSSPGRGLSPQGRECPLWFQASLSYVDRSCHLASILNHGEQAWVKVQVKGVWTNAAVRELTNAGLDEASMYAGTLWQAPAPLSV